MFYVYYLQDNVLNIYVTNRQPPSKTQPSSRW